MPDAALADLRQKAKRWLIALIISGIALAISIVLGLGATVWRLQQTFDHVDNYSITDKAFKAMIDRSLLWTKLGFAIGCLAFVAYIFCGVMRHRTRNQVRIAEEKARRRPPELS